MIDLNREVHDWCTAVHASRCRADASIEELKDHLHCEIERLQGEGYSAEQAFATSTERLTANAADRIDSARGQARAGKRPIDQRHGLVADQLTARFVTER